MAERGSRMPADESTATANAIRILNEGKPGTIGGAIDATRALRQELEKKGLKGFKRGGKVKKTGVAKVHKGERVLTAKQAKKPAVKKVIARRAAPRRKK